MDDTIKLPNNLPVLKFFKKLAYHIFVSLLALVLALLFPILLLIIYFPMWGTRQAVKLLAKIIRPDLSDMATPATTTCANANGSKHNPRMVTLVELLFEEGKSLKFEEVVTEFNSRAVEKVLIVGGEGESVLQYPSLKQYLTSWLGFYFWKQDHNFDIKNHITCSNLGKDFVTGQDLLGFEQSLLCKPFVEGRSPWELLVIPNTFLSTREDSCSPDFLLDPPTVNLTTTIIFRCSHALADGYSVKKLLQAVSTVKVSPMLKINYPSKTLLQKLLFPLKFYYTMAEVQVLSLSKFPFKMNKEEEKSVIDTVQSSDIIPVEAIRKIKELHGVSFTSVLICIATGAYRKFWLKKNGGKNQFYCDTVPCAIPLPKPGHPDTLTNHFTLAAMPLPIGIADPIPRLQTCHRELLNLRCSAYPAAAACFMNVFGSFFNKIGELAGINNFSAVNISYLPSGLESISFLGVDIVGQAFCMGVQKGSIGAVIAVSSFKDRIQMHATVDTNVIPREIVMEFKSIVNQEVAALITCRNNV